jgi:hypothetical protein
MGTSRRLLFRSVGFQIVALVAALSSARAQNAAAFGANASGRSQRAGAAFVGGTFQPPGLVDASHRAAQSGSGFFASSPGQSAAAANEPSASAPVFATSLTAPSGSGSTGSQTFAYTTPGDTFGLFVQPNDLAITGNDLFPPLLDILRTGISGGTSRRPVPDGVGGNMDTSGANHFEASLAPHWVFCRNSRYPVTVTLPTQVTVADDPYYFGHHFGWVAAGVNVRVPLSFIPRQYGKWSATTSADFCYYGTTTTEFANSIGMQIPKRGAALSLDL